MLARGSRSDPPEDSVAAGLARVFRQLTGFIVLLALGLSVVLVLLVTSVRPDQSRYRTADEALELAHSGMVDQETGLRGYLLVADESLLSPYHAGVDVVSRENEVLGRQIGSDADLAPMLLDMRLAEQAWASEWASAVLDPAQRPKPEDEAAFLGRGKQLFDRYRDSEAALRDRLRSRRESLYTREGWLLLCGLGVTLVLGAGLMVVVVRQRRHLEEAVTAPVTDILAATEAVAQGHLGAELTPSGPRELRRIGESINQMRASLQEALDRRRVAQEQVERQAGQLSAILSMSREISGSLNLGYVLRTVAEVATTVSGFPRVVVWLADDESATTLHAAYDSGRAGGQPNPEVRVEQGVGVVGQAVRYGRTATSKEAGEPSVEVNPELGLVGAGRAAGRGRAGQRRDRAVGR